MSRFIVSLMVIALATPVFAMGGKKPTDHSTTKRVLKKRIDVGKIKARPFTIPGGGSFDFEAAVNAQIITVLQKSGRFTFRVPGMTSTSVIDKFLHPAPMAVEAVGPVPSCEVDMSQFKLEGMVTGFEFLSSFGIRFGYTVNGDLNGVSGDIGIKVDTAQMDLSMYLADVLSGFSAASSNVKSNQTKTQISANINFQNFTLGPQYYFETPLARVSEKGLAKAVNDLVSQTDKLSWEAHVLEDQDVRVWINAGARAGIQVGDEFEIYNLEYLWDGPPCEIGSRYRGSIPTPKPVSIIRIDSLGDDISAGAPVMQTVDNPQPGAKVVVHKLVGR